MEKLRAKFYCTSLQEHKGTDGLKYAETVNLSAVYGTDDKDNEENNQFAEATPSGEMEMYISNVQAFDFIKEGDEFYLDFIKVKKD